MALTGVIYEQMGKVDSALNNYLQAIELGEHNPQLLQRTVQLLFAKQRYDEAQQLLRQFEQQQVNFSPDMNRLTASVALQKKEFDRAVETARKAAAGSKSHETHVWLGQVLGVVARQAKTDGQSKKAAELAAEAEKAFRRAVELEPKVAMTWVGLVQFLGASGAKDQANRQFRRPVRRFRQSRLPWPWLNAMRPCMTWMLPKGSMRRRWRQPPTTRQPYTPWPVFTFARESRRRPKKSLIASSTASWHPPRPICFGPGGNLPSSSPTAATTRTGKKAKN